MSKSKSSSHWLKAHHSDEYVLRAKREGYRSRAVYKLKELDEKYNILRPGMCVLDLGAAPGGWSQYSASRVGAKGCVIASDVLPMDSIAGVEFIQGDFTEDYVLVRILEQLQEQLGRAKVDLVLSDMAPNMSGVDVVDIPRAMALTELAEQLAKDVLKSGGSFLCKLFQGPGTDQWLRNLRRQFSKVVISKPKASRPRSREVYVMATGFTRHD